MNQKPELSPHIHLAKWLLGILRPSILTQGPRQPLKSTSYLDGLRGFAAFIVYLQHHQVMARISHPHNSTDIFANAFGYNNQYYFACLPFIRIFFSGGHFAVAVFFVISGYVLSKKPLELMRRMEFGRFEEALAGSLFRRWLRLYLPVIGTTVGYATTWHVFSIWMPYPPHQSNYLDELSNWCKEFKNFSFVFRTGEEKWFPYNFHLWSIPVEIRGSIVVYTALLTFSRSRQNVRLWCEAVLIAYFLYIVDGWFYAMFVAGLLICELDLLYKEQDLPIFFSKLEPYIHKKGFFYLLFVMSLYLGGVPSFDSDPQILKASPGWYYLSFLSTPVLDYKWFHLFFASIFLVISTPHIYLKHFFDSKFCQYLGRISFALYLVHGPVLWTLGDRLYLAAGWSREDSVDGVKNWVDLWPISKAGPLGLEWAFLVPHFVLLPITLWGAEIVERLFDGPSILFSRWLYERTLAPSIDL
jgi:peptidoglycan/LPS O-acetylase OafA/YrhL